MIGNRTNRIFIQPDNASGKLSVRTDKDTTMLTDYFSGEFEGVSKHTPKNTDNVFYRFNFHDGNENYTLSLPESGARDVIRALLSIEKFNGVVIRIDAKGKTVQTRFGVKNMVNLYVSVNGQWVKWAIPAPEGNNTDAWFEQNMALLNSRCSNLTGGEPQATVQPHDVSDGDDMPPAGDDENFFNEQ